MIKFVLGEDKYIRLTVKSRKNESFIVTLSTWELITRDDNIESSGNCDVIMENNTNYIKAKINPKQRGSYILSITYHIADEILKERIMLGVV